MKYVFEVSTEGATALSNLPEGDAFTVPGETEWYMMLDEVSDDGNTLLVVCLGPDYRGQIHRYNPGEIVTPARSLKVIINGSDS